MFGRGFVEGESVGEFPNGVADLRRQTRPDRKV